MPVSSPPISPLAKAHRPPRIEGLGHRVPPIAAGLVLIMAISLPSLITFAWLTDDTAPAIGDLSGLILGSLSIAAFALAIAIPLSLWGAIALTELTSERLQRSLLPALALAARLPAVLYGWLGLTLLTEFYPSTWPSVTSKPIMSVGIILALMLLPSMTFGFAERFKGVSQSLRLGAYALGAGPLSTAFRVVIPSVKGAILGRISRAAARASGEGIIILLFVTVASSPPTLSSALLSSAPGMPGSLWSIAMALLLLSLPFALGEALARRWGQV